MAEGLWVSTGIGSRFAVRLPISPPARSSRARGVYFFFEDGGSVFLCNEINTITGLTPISMYPNLWQASGLTYRQLIDELVRLALERHALRRRNTSR